MRENYQQPNTQDKIQSMNEKNVFFFNTSQGMNAKLIFFGTKFWILVAWLYFPPLPAYQDSNIVALPP